MGSIRSTIIKRTLKVPLVEGRAGDGSIVTRQLDITLMSVGFKLSKELLNHLSVLHPIEVKNVSTEIFTTVRQLVGDHVKHNVYFKEFPENIPDTMEFWAQCILDALFDPRSASNIALQVATGTINLLDLPKYGRYQHTYNEMIDVHEQFIPHIKKQITVLHLGNTLFRETWKLYNSLAASTVPLGDEDRDLLVELAELCCKDKQPDIIPVRENKAIINQARLNAGLPLLADTVTDVLRLAALLSDGDVTLLKSTRFKSFRRSTRRIMLEALDEVVAGNVTKLQDVNRYPERWKRLGERLHQNERKYKQFKFAKQVFEVARGEMQAKTLASRVESAFAEKDIKKVISLLAAQPGMLFRGLDRILRNIPETEVDYLLGTFQEVIKRVSGRVILSLSEHLQNRIKPIAGRVFANSDGKVWVTPDLRVLLPGKAVVRLTEIFDTEITRRLQKTTQLVVDQEVLNLALPLSDKNKSDGFNVVPRGSDVSVDAEILRFFVYWKQRNDRTDYDLSVLLLNEDFSGSEWISYTQLRGQHGCHSGDIVEAPNGASEFIDIDLLHTKAKYIVPQVNIYAGEDFNKVEECFFGFMNRTTEQKGKPFEPHTVQFKSDLRGKGRISLPVIFIHNDDGTWTAKWMHLYLKGRVDFNRVETNKSSTALIVKSIVNREYIQLTYLIKLMRTKTDAFSFYTSSQRFTKPITYIGLVKPEGIPEGSKIYTLTNLHELIPV